MVKEDDVLAAKQCALARASTEWEVLLYVAGFRVCAWLACGRTFALQLNRRYYRSSVEQRGFWCRECVEALDRERSEVASRTERSACSYGSV